MYINAECKVIIIARQRSTDTDHEKHRFCDAVDARV